MGKHRPKKGSRICVYDGHPGCLWGIILHVLDYEHWSYVKKRLPHWKIGGNKQATEGGNPETNEASDAGKLQEISNTKVNNSNAEEKVRQAAPANKNSVKAKIKAMISEELSKRNAGHYQSSTYPARRKLTRTNSIHRLDPSNEDFLAKIISGDESPGIVNESNGNFNAVGSMDALLPKSLEKPVASEETPEDCQFILTQNDVGHNQIVETETQRTESHIPLQENIDDTKQALLEINTKELTADALLCRSEEILSALDIINLNKEFFMKLLHDPSSPLAHHFHSQQTLSARLRLTKSETFPLPGLSDRRGRGSRKLKQKKNVIVCHEIEQGKIQVDDQSQNSFVCESEEDIYKQSMTPTIFDYRADGIQKSNEAMAESGGSSSGSSYHQKNHVRNQVVVKHFKDLRHKIKHAMKQSENERHRIALDAVLHKIPQGQGFSTGLRKGNFDQFRDPFIRSDGTDSPASSYQSDTALTALSGKSGLHRVRRAPSLSETLNTYSQLNESSFNREAMQHISGGLKLRREEVALPSMSTPKSPRRILSLPELKSYFYQSEDPFDASPSWMLVRAPVEETVSISSFDEKNSTDMSIASEYSLQLDTLVEGQIQETLGEVSETDSGAGDQVGSTSIAYSNVNAKVAKLSGDLCNFVKRDITSNDEEDIEPVATILAESSPVPELDFDFQDVAESTTDFSFSEESEVKSEYLIPGEQDSLSNHQDESSMDAHTVANSSDFEKVEISSHHVHIDIPHVEVDAKDKAKFDYVTNILKLSGFSGSESLRTWHCDYQPVDPSVYEEVEGCILHDCSGNEGGNSNHMLFFDLINEVLMDIYERSYSYYPKPLSSLCHIHPMPAGYHVLTEVWSNISWYLRLRPELDQSLNYIASGDLSKNDGWMNLQFDSECVGLELEDLIFEDLLEEAIFS